MIDNAGHGEFSSSAAFILHCLISGGVGHVPRVVA